MRLPVGFLRNEATLKSPKSLSPKREQTPTQTVKPKPARPLFIMDQDSTKHGDFIMAMNREFERKETIEPRFLYLKQNREEIDENKFKSIKQKMFFQTLKSKKRPTTDTTHEISDKDSAMRQIKKLLRPETASNGLKAPQSLFGRPSTSINYTEKNRSHPKKLRDLKKYLVKGQELGAEEEEGEEPRANTANFHSNAPSLMNQPQETSHIIRNNSSKLHDSNLQKKNPSIGKGPNAGNSDHFGAGSKKGSSRFIQQEPRERSYRKIADGQESVGFEGENQAVSQGRVGASKGPSNKTNSKEVGGTVEEQAGDERQGDSRSDPDFGPSEQGKSVSGDLDLNEIFEVEDFLEKMKGFFLGYYRRSMRQVLDFVRMPDTLITVRIIRRLMETADKNRSKLVVLRKKSQNT